MNRILFRILSSAVLLLLFLSLMSLDLALVFGVREQTWSQTILVPGGQSRVATGGVFGVTNVSVSGTVAIQSCCGYSTNDIVFQIIGVDFGGQYYGRISGNFSFEWNSGRDHSYDLSLDNRWLVCKPVLCEPDPSNSSYHDKTVVVNVKEVAPARLEGLFPLLQKVAYFMVGGLVVGGVVLSIAVLLHRQRRRGSTSHPAVN